MLDKLMQAIPIDEALKRPQVLVDLYLRLKSNKFILIAKGGSPTPIDSIQKYKVRDVKILFVKIEDYRRLILATP